MQGRGGVALAVAGALGSAVTCLACADAASSEPPGHVAVVAIDSVSGETIPCRVRVRIAGAEPRAPSKTRDVAAGLWTGTSAVTHEDDVLAADCDLEIPVDPGTYRVVVASGTWYEQVTREVAVASGETVRVDASMVRSVDPEGWGCYDLHVHSAPSFDSDVPLGQRLVAALAQGLDGFVATDHDALGDWAAATAAFGMEERLVVVPGTELTLHRWDGWDSAPRGHFNVYPVPADLDPIALQTRSTDVAALFAEVRAVVPGVFVQLNHPRWDERLGYFDSAGLDRATLDGARGPAWLGFDVLEVWTGERLRYPGTPEPEEAILDWFAMLSAGHRVIATANSDSHGLHRVSMGTPRTCVQPAERSVAGFLDEIRRGHAFLTSGPWLGLVVGGESPGGTARGARFDVRVDVRAASWVPVESVSLYHDGEIVETRPIDALPFTFETVMDADRDGWVVALASGEPRVPWPISGDGVEERTLALTNPVWIDVP